MLVRRLITALCLGLLASTVTAGAARGAVPPRFFGVVSQASLSASDFGRMEGTVGTLRVSLDWSAVEPQPGRFEDAPFDAVVEEAAQRGVRVLPVLTGRPSWLPGPATASPVSSAVGRRAWREFVSHLADRYGPGGELWGAGVLKPAPIRTWQIGNEPNFALYWPHPSPRAYARLLHIATTVLRTRDPGARIVLAGLAPVDAGPWPWDFLRDLYRVPDIRREFDVVALHPYSWNLAQLRYQVRKIRQVMARAGDGSKPLLISELGVASGGVIDSPFDLGRRGQARFLRRSFALLLARRQRWRIAGVNWFAWQDVGYPDGHCSFCERSGLFDTGGRAKPAWHAYRRLVSRQVR